MTRRCATRQPATTAIVMSAPIHRDEDELHVAATRAIEHALLLRGARSARTSPVPPPTRHRSRRAFLRRVLLRDVAPRLPFTCGAARVAEPRRRRAVQLRGARLRTRPSTRALDRFRRANHRLFLVEEKRIAPLETQFVVMGVNASVYHVHIGVQPNCDCPDFVNRAQANKHGPCKHIIFVFLNVRALHPTDHRWFQHRLLPSELHGLLESPSPQYRNASAPPRTKPIQRPCPVCFESLAHTDLSHPQNVVSFCTLCANNYHTVCFNHFNRTRQNTTCPACHNLVHRPASAPIAQRPNYLNLMAYSPSHQTQLTLADMYAHTHQHITRNRTTTPPK
ncbi:unnamed protein product [Agarophyton chilense]|eukprot:gb/GEZJ01002704.1/.p1 GENE.gb/GEZJ01002704.1/~~gb/GEZJ01002704.1/.p1  ORF type:complete len:336 (+),score=31.16 gb/GEZJ01002704.1/:178-1185(+)